MHFLNDQLHQRLLEKKKKLDDLRPLPPSFIFKIQEHVKVENIQMSNEIESNILVLGETKMLLEDSYGARGKQLREFLEPTDPEVIEIIEQFAKGMDLKELQILTIHKIIMRGDVEDAGRYRSGKVGILNSNYTPPQALDIPIHITKMIEKYNQNPKELLSIELAAWLHLRIVQIHPFREGNGRIARVLMNLTLLRHGYPTAIVSRVNRADYYDGLRKADKSDFSPFANFVASRVEQALDTYLDVVDPDQESLISQR